VKEMFVEVKGTIAGLTRSQVSLSLGVTSSLRTRQRISANAEPEKNLHKAVLISLLISVAFLNQNTICNSFSHRSRALTHCKN